LSAFTFRIQLSRSFARHHERWDGTGYPDGLKGEEIPIGARILSAVDCLDALATDRQYRKALPLDDAMQWVVDQAGKAYDPKGSEPAQNQLQRTGRNCPSTAATTGPRNSRLM